MQHERSDVTLPPHPTLTNYYANPHVKREFLTRIFDETAKDYDRVESLMSLGSGSWYRRRALLRAGLSAGMSVLDIAVGTGLVAREEINIVGSKASVTGVDPSWGMMRQAVESLGIRAAMGLAEAVPFGDEQFDFLSMGYALRHLSDLHKTFAEFYRVLRPGAKLCILEITCPQSRLGRWLLRIYMRRWVPLITRASTRRAPSQRLWEYYWDTIESCLPPETVLSAITQAGFTDVRRTIELGIFSDYTAIKPYVGD